jgi:quinol monooxygenase YgiN
MSLVLLQIDFAFDGPWADDLAQACRELADDIAREPGLRWKLWTEDAGTGRAGGVYLFESRELAARYLDKHRDRLAAFGVTDLRARLFDVNETLSQRTRGPMGGAAAPFTTLASVRISDRQRFLDVFSTRGMAKRRRHGSRGAETFVTAEAPDSAHVLIDWADRDAFESFRADPEVRATMQSGGALEPPAFVVLERTGRFAV